MRQVEALSRENGARKSRKRQLLDSVDAHRDDTHFLEEETEEEDQDSQNLGDQQHFSCHVAIQAYSFSVCCITRLVRTLLHKVTDVAFD